MAGISPIDSKTIHQICSGQVISNLGSAVKELLENSLDAKATKIEIKLIQFGSSSIEVIDNGVGVQSQYFEGLTAKYHTSKIKDFDELTQGVSTFGFRGEALSSLCGLGQLSLTTQHSSETLGTRLLFDSSGVIKSRERVHRPYVGTSVVLKNLFESLPVRRKAFLSSLKRQFNQMLDLMRAYLLISTSVSISIVNYTENSVRPTLYLKTKGNQSVFENISEVFGVKASQNLLFYEGVSKEFKVSGYISNPFSNTGKRGKESGFLFVNGRPVESNKVLKIGNELYSSFNSSTHPFLLIDLIVQDPGLLDVNLTPDKRSIFIENEAKAHQLLQDSLTQVLEKTSGTFSYEKNPSDSLTENESYKRKGLFSSSYSFYETSKKSKSTNNDEYFTSVKEKIGDSFILEDKAIDYKALLLSKIQGRPCAKDSKTTENSLTEVLYKSQEKCNTNQQKEFQETINNNQESSEFQETMNNNQQKEFQETININQESSEFQETIQIQDSLERQETLEKNESTKRLNVFQRHSNFNSYQLTTDNSNVLMRIDESVKNSERKSITIPFIMTRLQILSPQRPFVQEPRKFFTSFDQQGVNNNIVAEEELKSQICKSDFVAMSVIGQFNLGFILARHNNDLFIFDQHACDEKYNFEKLNKTCVLKSQAMVIPQRILETDSLSRSVLLEHLELFKLSGFDFDVRNSEEIYLKSIPMTKNMTFGAEDVEELLESLKKEGKSNCRPPRMQVLFASKACRSSIMIGSPLNRKVMSKLLAHMSEMDHPWNCPHGRPTFRHLFHITHESL